MSPEVNSIHHVHRLFNLSNEFLITLLCNRYIVHDFKVIRPFIE